MGALQRLQAAMNSTRVATERSTQRHLSSPFGVRNSNPISELKRTVTAHGTHDMPEEVGAVQTIQTNGEDPIAQSLSSSTMS